MARYRILIKSSAAKELEAVPSKRDRRRLVSRIRALADDPRPRGCEKLGGHQNRFRVRQGAYRIVYSVEDRDLIVYVMKLGHRKDVHR